MIKSIRYINVKMKEVKKLIKHFFCKNIVVFFFFILYNKMANIVRGDFYIQENGL